MPAKRTCSECGKSLQGFAPQAKTCGVVCRQARSRRVRTLDRAAARDARQHVSAPVAIQQIADAVNEVAGKDLISKVVQQELRPIVRDALTEETMQAIQSLLKLTPRAVAALAEDLEDEDAVIRQRAYSLAIKYTIGHPALVKGDDADGSKQIVINFDMPRPDSAPAAEAVEIDVLRHCTWCDEDKPEAEFVGASDRCRQCFDELQARVAQDYAD